MPSARPRSSRRSFWSPAAITLLGYGTLVTSSYPPLRSIGVVSAVSVVALAAASVLVLPALLLMGHEAMTMRAVALIPAFNEAGSIAQVVHGVRGAVAHVIVVDDGSTDGTAERARAAGAEVMAHTARTAARARGADRPRARARRATSRTCCCSTATCSICRPKRRDCSRRPSAPAPTSCSASGGSSATQMPASRYHANRIGSRVLSWFVGVPVQDTQCGFRVFRVDALRPLRLSATGYEIETEMLVKVRRRGGRVASVPVTAVYAGQQQQAAAGARHHAHLFSGGVLSIP